MNSLKYKEGNENFLLSTSTAIDCLTFLVHFLSKRYISDVVGPEETKFWTLRLLLEYWFFRKNLWPSPLSCPRDSDRETCFRKEICRGCLLLLWIKHSYQEGFRQVPISYIPLCPIVSESTTRISCLRCSLLPQLPINQSPILTFEI